MQFLLDVNETDGLKQNLGKQGGGNSHCRTEIVQKHEVQRHIDTPAQQIEHHQQFFFPKKEDNLIVKDGGQSNAYGPYGKDAQRKNGIQILFARQSMQRPMAMGQTIISVARITRCRLRSYCALSCPK